MAAREASVTAHELAWSERLLAAAEIVAAADARDAISDSRDVGGDTREQHIDRAYSLATGKSSGKGLPPSQGAALDRDHAKADRQASRQDRISLTTDPDDPETS